MELDSALKEYFGFDSFRSGQREVIERALSHSNTLAVLPTGLGKSLCYQLPAQLMPGITLVISPLIALMRDQVESLKSRGFKNVTYLNSSLDAATISSRYREIEDGWYKLVYVAPERCDSPRFRQMLGKAKVDLLVIDEAHCISQWGHDFRPHYRTLLKRLPELSDSTILAMTATATPEVQKDIIAVLGRDMERVVADFNRPNLFFEVIEVDDREEKNELLYSKLSKSEGSAIVYTSTRKEAEAACQFLQSREIRACYYHAGMPAGSRTEAQRLFQAGARPVIVATVAFGMGIDKADVRRVIHYNIPGSIESYYQEAGRAGRDGNPAICTFLFTNQDIRVQQFLIESSYPDHVVVYQVYDALRAASPRPLSSPDIARATDLPELTVRASLQMMYEQQHIQITPEGRFMPVRNELTRPPLNFRPVLERRRRAEKRLETIIGYAEGESCRRQKILAYFGQRFDPPCGACDVCQPSVEPGAAEGNARSDRIARIILAAVEEFGGRLGRTVISETLTGSRRKKLIDMQLDSSRSYGGLRVYPKDKVLNWIDELIKQKLLATTHGDYPVVFLTDKGRRALGGSQHIALSGFESRREELQPSASVVQHASGKRTAKPEDRRTSSNESRIEKETDAAAFQPVDDARKGLENLRLQIEIFRQGGPPPAIEALINGIDDGNATRGDLVVIISALGEIADDDAAETIKPVLSKLLVEGADPGILSAVCGCLAKINAVDLVGRIINLLEDERAGVRQAAARSLGKMRVGSAMERLKVMAINDSAAGVRLAASAALVLIASEDSGE